MKNQYMVQKSDAMLIIYDPEKEGSPKYPYMKHKSEMTLGNYPIWQISFDDLQQVAEEDNVDE